MLKRKILAIGFLAILIAGFIAICPPLVLDTQAKTKMSITAVNHPWRGDYKGMVERNIIRVLVPYSKTFYFLDGAKPRGATYEIFKHFEKELNKQLGKGVLKVNLIIIPTPRDQLIPGLKEGLGDIAAGNLTITRSRLKEVDFTVPMYDGVNEVLVAGPDSNDIVSLDTLGGKEIHVRKSSSYYTSLLRHNNKLKRTGKKPVAIVPANEYLEDEDLMEMVNAGLISMVVVDNHKANFWVRVFDNIKVHENIKFRQNAKIAWAIRKNSPELMEVLNQFIKKHRKGTLIGNIIINRYFKSVDYVKNSYKDDDQKRFEVASIFFKKYADTYDFDWLMLAALAYQESGIDQSKRSHAGAVGVMQILPSTAKDKNVGVPDIEKIAPNIHAGTKYLRFIMDRYFNDPDIDELNRMLLSFASYNAGPNKILQLRKKSASMGLNPNIWFRNVEIVAAEVIGRETVQYVSNIFKYYIAYCLILKNDSPSML